MDAAKACRAQRMCADHGGTALTGRALTLCARTRAVYTLFLWATLDYSISQGEVAHDNDAVLLAPNARTLGLPQAMTLPKAGVLIMYDDGSTAPTDSNATIRFQWQQNVICRGGSTRKRTEPMPGYPCEFYSVEDGFLRTNATL